MKKTVKFALLLIALLTTFNIDAKVDKKQLLGVWTQIENEQGINFFSTYDFKEDGTVTQFVIVTAESPKINIVADGTCKYQLKDDTITFKFSASDFNFTTMEIEGLPEEMKGMVMQQIMSQMVNVEQKLTNVKIDGNTLTAKANGVSITLRRK